MDRSTESPSDSKERAVSSEPCSTRPNPFDDDGSSARKRRRTSLNGVSPSRSVETPKSTHDTSIDSPEAALQAEQAERDSSMTMDSAPSEPRTPEPQREQVQPTSESKPTRITLNLKNRKQESNHVPSSPISSNDADAELEGSRLQGIRLSVEDTELDVSHTLNDFRDTGSPTLDIDNPPIEIIDDDDDDDDESQDGVPQVILLQDPDDGEEPDPVTNFPYNTGDPVAEALSKLCQQHMPTNINALTLMRSWLDDYLAWASTKDRGTVQQNQAQYHDFWHLLPPQIVQHSSPHRNPVPRNPQFLQMLNELHVTFAKLTAFFVELDCSTLDVPVTSEDGYRDTLSAHYALYLNQLLQDYAIAFAPNMITWEVDSFWPEMLSRILDGYRSLRAPAHSVCRLGCAMADLVPRFPKLVENLSSIAQLTSYMVRDDFIRQQSAALSQSDSSKALFSQAYELYDAGSRSLAVCIDKHVNQIIPPVAESLINGLTDILRVCLRAGCEKARDLIKDHQHMHPEIPTTESAKVIVAEWRLATLTKLIRSSQMQLRILAAGDLCSDLVRIWKDHHELHLDLSQHPVLCHISKQLLDSGVVAYVLGPTCHPEVTLMSGNIIGFLFVTNTFTEEHLDFLWNTVTTCQVSGVAESLLTMLGNISNLLPAHEVLCIVRKLHSIPIEEFTPTMKEFSEKLMSQLSEKQDRGLGLLPYSFMFKLLRESSAPGPPYFQVVQRWAATLILQLFRHGPSPEDRFSLYQECLQDLTLKTRYTLGSLHGLWLLCRPVSRERDLHQLTTQFNLPKLLVDELEHAVVSRDSTGLIHVISGPQNAPRLELLMTIIIHGPETITQDLGQRLWELLVGNQSTTLEDKDCAWQSLNNAMKSWPDNQFLHTCFSEYCPSLPPELFRPGTLDFVLQKILPALNHENSMILYEEDSEDRLAIEQLWRIAMKAPSGTIERRAIMALVKDVYMESRSIQTLPLHRARNVHLMLVDRCMKQLSSAAKQLTGRREMVTHSGLDSMAIDVNQQASEHELFFTRSLTIVREFHKLHQQTAQFSSPDMRSLVLPQTDDVEGDSAELKFQSFDGDTQTDVKPLTIGRRNTAGSLLASIRDATGFDNYRLYYKGRVFLPTEQDICRSLEDLQIHNGLILVKREADASEAPMHVRPGASPVEIEIMRHFQELWEYLALEEKLGSEIYAFLVTLPIDDRILCALESETTTYQDLFPIGHPLKSLYALHAIREYLSSQSALAKSQQENIFYDGALRRILGLVTFAISDRAVIDNSSGVELKAALATRLVEQLLATLRDPSRPFSTPEFLNVGLIERLLEILSSSLATDATSIAPTLIAVAFHAVLEACSLKMDIWTWLHSEVDMRKVVRQLLIDDDRGLVRRSTATIIGDKATNTPSLSVVPASAFREFFLPLILDLIPFALTKPKNSLEAFNVASILFRPLSEATSPVIDLPKTVQSLSEQLLEYEPSEVASVVLALPSPRIDELLSSHNLTQPGGTDVAAYGLVSLLHSILCTGHGEAVLETLPSDFASLLFWRCLFVRQLTNPDLLWQGNLIFNELTRSRLNDIVLKVTGRDSVQLRELLKDLNLLVACKSTSKYSDDGPLYRYDLPFYFERSKALRAPAGYAGLRNLSNTCYLNSLCTQLFMNVDFRQFMLNADVDTRDRSRALLSQTQWLFGQLQSSNQRSVDPEDFVGSIKTYDDDIINIHHQMDVEEFFNLLNDRWEAQLRSPEAVRRFRSFYGGQLVTQTKSKECDHISEVMEPFSAIQCDIKGKRSLLESLDAYVEGEHMEGDNKYKCSTCDRHVDAVRRSCLKEMPDSLIFHLKRFDFNLRTQARSKINDYFAFPERLNMQPYTIEHLSNSPEGSTEDWFELVGVLIHAGTAESGHYYSFIQERPTSRKDESWFEFNDDLVSPWDPSKMEAACFGGTETSWDNGGATYEKNYCAYMLFYERSSALQRKQQELERLGCLSPIQRRIPAPLSNWIRTENLKQLQRHCLFDPDHIRFLDAIFDRMQELNHGACSDDHDIETQAIKAAIAHLDQVASRVRDAPDAQRLTDRIREFADNCGKCAFAIHEYFTDHREVFRNMVQRNPEASVRSAVADILLVAVISIKETYSGAYYASTGSDDESDDFQEDVVAGVCTLFETIWNSFHIMSLHRSWPEVFDMMERFLELGNEELLGFLNRDFFMKTMLVLVAPELPEKERDAQFSKFCNVLARRPNRSPSYAAIIGLLRQVLTSVTVNNPVRDCVSRGKMFAKYPDQPLRLTSEESDLLHKRHSTRGNVLLDKLIFVNQHLEATDDIFIHILQQNWALALDVLDTLLINTAPQASFFVYAPYLRVAVQFCHWSHDAEHIDNLIAHIARHSKVLATNEPKAVWNFFKQTLEGPRHNSGESSNTLEMQCLQYLPEWVPVLLVQYDLNISVLVDNILNEKIFQYGPNPQFDEEDGGEERAKAVVTCARQIGRECCEHVQETCISRSQSVTSQTVAILQRVLSKCGEYFDETDDSPGSETQRFFRTRHTILENLRRLSVDDLEDDGSGMFADSDSSLSEPSVPKCRVLTPPRIEDWENSVASSEQADSLADEEIKEMDI